MNKPLQGRGIVVTRPAHQATRLAELICAAGGSAIRYPTIEIADLDDPQPLLELIDRLDEFEVAIFVSPNAVTRAMERIASRRNLPARLQIAAIGNAGARALEGCGVANVLAPARYDSEALLDLPEMKDVAGKRIVIFRGLGGRELLRDTLIERGATIEYAQCYQRRRPNADFTALREAWARGGIHAITATSSEGLRNLMDLAGVSNREWLAVTPLFVTHLRIECTARKLGFSRVVMSGQGDEQLVRGLIEWFSGAQ